MVQFKVSKTVQQILFALLVAFTLLGVPNLINYGSTKKTIDSLENPTSKKKYIQKTFEEYNELNVFEQTFFFGSKLAAIKAEKGL